MPSAAQLFMGQFASKTSTPDAITCFTEKPKPPPSCGSSCLLNCDLRPAAPQNNFDVTVEDIDSDVESNCTDSTGTISTNSSVEDARDAFEQFLEPEEPPIASKRLKSAATYRSLSLVPTIKKETDKKTYRQKSDAASLKKYAYGKLFCYYYYNHY